MSAQGTRLIGPRRGVVLVRMEGFLVKVHVQPCLFALHYCLQVVSGHAGDSFLALDELNAHKYPGETLALLECIGIKNLLLKKTPFDPYISYAIIA